MPISYVIHSDFRLIVTRYSGYVADDEYRKIHATIFSDPDCEPGFNELADMRELEGSNITSRSMSIVAAMAKELDGNSATKPKLAVVVAGNLQVGLTRMYGAYADFQDSELVRRFHDVREALKWLDATAMPVEKLFRDH